MSFSVALLALAASTCVVPPNEAAAQQALSYADFDGRAGAHGSCALAASSCTDQAVALLAAYAEANRDRLAPPELGEIAFHRGQTLAMAGREADSIADFERALYPATPERHLRSRDPGLPAP